MTATTMNPFIDTAKTLFNERGLSIGGIIYEFAEIEFYLTSSEHPDPYTHQHPEQSQFAKWYFHRMSNGTYKGGTFKGLDLTLGSESMYYGILIRAIWNSNIGLICGPCKVVDHILSTLQIPSISALTHDTPGERKCLDVKNNDAQLHLVHIDHTSTEPIYVGPRIGLSDTYPEWVNKPYRFVRRYTAGPFKAKRTLVKL